ncbi:MAG TPA: SPFH domain-containing protein, partial [Streptosporangiaceae bacterium]
MSISNLGPWGIVLVAGMVILLLVVLASMARVLPEYERAVIFRLGNVLRSPKGPGLFLLLPFGIDRMVKVNLQTVTMNVPPQDIITRDNVNLRVDTVLNLRVINPIVAVVEVQNYLFATSQAAQTNLRVILGKKTLNELLSAREEINAELSAVIAGVTKPWGVRVTSVEVKDVELPEELQRARAREVETERDDMEARSRRQWTAETKPVASVPDVPEDLVAALDKGQCVLFSGAGTAARAGWPTWRQMLSRLLERLEREDPSWRTVRELGQDPELVTELVSGRLDSSGLLQHLEGILPRDHVPTGLPALHRLLKQLPFAGVVTTSWDDLIERTFQDRDPVVLLPKTPDDVAWLLREERFFLMRANGVLSDDELLFTTAAFRRVMY